TSRSVEQLTVDADLGCALLLAGAPPENVIEMGSLAGALRTCVGGVCARNTEGELVIDEDRSKLVVARWPLLPGDVVVICTDGLVEDRVFLEPEDRAEWGRQHIDLPASALAVKLAEAADARQRLPSPKEPAGFGDNITCAVIKVTAGQGDKG